MSQHRHAWREVGERMRVELAREQCTCGETRLQMVDPQNPERRVSVVLPLGVMRAVKAGSDVLAVGREASQIALEVLALFDKTRRQLGIR